MTQIPVPFVVLSVLFGVYLVIALWQSRSAHSDSPKARSRQRPVTGQHRGWR
jgi:hypothetical protein